MQAEARLRGFKVRFIWGMRGVLMQIGSRLVSPDLGLHSAACQASQASLREFTSGSKETHRQHLERAATRAFSGTVRAQTGRRQPLLFPRTVAKCLEKVCCPSQVNCWYQGTRLQMGIVREPLAWEEILLGSFLYSGLAWNRPGKGLGHINGSSFQGSLGKPWER